MENNEQPVEETPVEKPVEEVVEPVADEAPVEEPQETVEELKQRLANAQAENKRKAELLKEKEQEAERLRESRERVHQEESVDTILRRMSDNELTSYLNNAQYAVNHAQIREILDERRFERFMNKKREQQKRLDAEIELETKFPEILNPTSPLALKTKELMRLNDLENHPQGRLIAARLAASELSVKKAVAAGRKQEQTRQADVKANFSGDASRPAPKVSDKAKVEELHKRALQGDEEARLQWMAIRLNSKGAL